MTSVNRRKSEHYQIVARTSAICQKRKFNIQTGDTEGFVNFGLGIKGIVFSALIIDRSMMVKCHFDHKEPFLVMSLQTNILMEGDT